MAGARTDGVYQINRGGGAFSLYCDMTTAGGGWDLVSTVNSASLAFGVQRCTSLGGNCAGNINPTGDSFAQDLGSYAVLIPCGRCVAGIRCVWSCGTAHVPCRWSWF